MKVLIVYGSTEGHTRQVAEFVAELGQDGNEVEMFDSTRPELRDVELDQDAFVLAGSVHQGRHQAALVHWVRDHRETLNQKPTLFLSVSLCAADPDQESQDEAQRYIREFLEETGLVPGETHRIAGALLYTEYDFFKRYIMRKIAASHGGDTDSTKDFDYTDWPALKLIVERFLAIETA